MAPERPSAGTRWETLRPEQVGTEAVALARSIAEEAARLPPSALRDQMERAAALLERNGEASDAAYAKAALGAPTELSAEEHDRRNDPRKRETELQRLRAHFTDQREREIDGVAAVEGHASVRDAIRRLVQLERQEAVRRLFSHAGRAGLLCSFGDL